MNNRVDLFLIKKRVKRCLIADVQFVKGRSLSGDRLNAINDHCLGIIEIIRDHNFITGLQQFHYSMTSDKTCSARNQYCHGATSFT